MKIPTRALVLCLLFSCSPRSPETSIRYGLRGPIREALFPKSLKYISDFFLTTQLWTTLLEPLSNQEPRSCLAKQITVSKNRLTWTFELFPDLKWSDGSPMTSSQLALSLKKALKRPTISGLGNQLRSVQATSPTAVVLVLREYSPLLIRYLAMRETALLDPRGPQDSISLHSRTMRYSGRYRPIEFKHKFVKLEPNPFFAPGCPVASLPADITGGLKDDDIVKDLLSGRLNIGAIVDYRLTSEDLRAFEKQQMQLFTAPADEMLAFHIGRHSRLIAAERRFLLKTLRTKWFPDPDSREVRASGFIPPILEGALTAAESDKLVADFKNLRVPKTLKVLVVKHLANARSYQSALSVLRTYTPKLSEVTYDLADARTQTVLDRNSGNFDLLFFTMGVYYPDTLSYIQGLELYLQSFNFSIPGIHGIEGIRSLGKEERVSRLATLARNGTSNPFVIPLSFNHSLRVVSRGLYVESSTMEFGEVELWRIKSR